MAGAVELLIDVPSKLLDGPPTEFWEGSDDTGSEWEEVVPKRSDPSKELSGRAANGSTTLLSLAELAKLVSVCDTGGGEAKKSTGAGTEAGCDALMSLAAPVKLVAVCTTGSEEAKRSIFAETEEGCEALLSLAALTKLVSVCTTGGVAKKSTVAETEVGCEANRSTSVCKKG